LEEVEAAQQKGENQRFIRLQLLARVERVFVVPAEDEAKLHAVHHIWSADYIDLRYSFRPEHPLLCLALRVFALPEPYMLPIRPEYTGCRSWLELEAPLSCAEARPVLNEAEFGREMEELRVVLG
jgi:hypothetical protein